VVGMLLLVVSQSVMVAFGAASMMFNKLVHKMLGKFPDICRNIMGIMLLARWGVGLRTYYYFGIQNHLGAVGLTGSLARLSTVSRSSGPLSLL
jgi:hypothetical protein